MITMNKAALVLALGSALAFGASNAMACTTSAWNGGTTGTPVAASPTANSDASVKRYSGLCGLQAQAGTASYVTDNSPNGETTYRARFYVYTGTVSAPGRVFSATASDNGGGSEVIAVRYNPGTNFEFLVNGASVGTAPAVGKRWYGIEVAFVSGTSFSARVKTTSTSNALQNTVTDVTAAAAPAAASIGSARLGNIDGVATTVAMNFDEFDSSRGTTPIGFLCRGNANADGVRNSTDGVVIRNEFFGYTSTAALSSYQPDCNEDGVVNSTDGVCVRNLFTAGAAIRDCATGP